MEAPLALWRAGESGDELRRTDPDRPSPSARARPGVGSGEKRAVRADRSGGRKFFCQSITLHGSCFRQFLFDTVFRRCSTEGNCALYSSRLTKNIWVAGCQLDGPSDSRRADSGNPQLDYIGDRQACPAYSLIQSAPQHHEFDPTGDARRCRQSGSAPFQIDSEQAR